MSREDKHFDTVSIGLRDISRHATEAVLKRHGNTYIIVAIAASLFNSIGYIVRGYESSRSILASNFIYTTTWLILPVLMLLYKKLRPPPGTIFRLPWWVN